MIKIVGASGGTLESGGVPLVAPVGGRRVPGKMDGLTPDDASGGFESRWLAQILRIGIPAPDSGGSEINHDVQNETGVPLTTEQDPPDVKRSGDARADRRGRPSAMSDSHTVMPAHRTSNDPRISLVHVLASSLSGGGKLERTVSKVQRSQEKEPQRVSDAQPDLQEAAQQRTSACSSAAQYLLAPIEPVIGNSDNRSLNHQVAEQEDDPSAQCPRVKHIDKPLGVAPMRQLNADCMGTMEIRPGEVAVQQGTDGKSSRQVRTDHPITEAFSSPAVASPKSPRLENGMDRDSPEVSKPAHSPAFCGSSSVQSPPSSPALAKRSHLRNMDGHTRDFDGQVNGPSNAVVVLQNASHAEVLAQRADQGSRDTQDRAVQSPSESVAPFNRAPDLPLKHTEPQWIHAGTHFAEAGFQDPSLGWISVRATRDPTGLHAIVVPPSLEAERTLSMHLSGLNAYLANNQIDVSLVALSSHEDARQASSFGGDAQQRNAREGRDERDDSRRPATVERVDSAATSPRMTTPDNLSRYGPPWIRSGASSREIHISLVA
jgi:hypothetical protein